ncbi:MAG: hypothetical protein KDA73_10670 [Rhodobacteraceae bacterium]|nr:hypothetical protein [Paracoccaceae bacterium]
MIVWSPSARAFYDTRLGAAPGDAVPVSRAEHGALLAGQGAGKRIVAGPNGRPELADPPQAAPSVADAEAERDRRIAAGTRIDVAGAGTIPVTGRPQDIAKLTGLGLRALARLVANDATPLSYHDAAGTLHALSPAQMLDLVERGARWVEACHAVVWAWAAGAGVPANFTNNAHWP